MTILAVEVREVKATIGPGESACGDLGKLALSANTKRLGSEPLTPERATLELPNLIKEEEDDPLTYLAALFELATLDDSEDSDDGSECDPDELAPGSPRSKDFIEHRYCFYASGQLHYFDDYRRVYSQNGTLIYGGSFDSQLEDLLTPNFYIGTAPYWFEGHGLLSQDTDGTLYPVHTWLSEPQVLDLDNLLGQPVPQVNVADFGPNSNTGSLYGTETTPVPTPANGYLTPKAKAESLSPNVIASSVRTLDEGSKPLVWSPTSSTYKSPIVSTASRESSLGPQPSLFPDLQLNPNVSHPIIAKWQGETAQARQDAERARPVKKPSKEDRRRCPECGKVFRRPSSLDDHLNVHSGKKPHICPFTGCKTGFATKSNMKRHFETHRVGPMERYRPGVTYQPSEPAEGKLTKSGRAPRGPTATYNAHAYHNGRFRIST